MSFRKSNPDLEKKLAVICNNATRLSERTELSFDDLFPESFMKIHTSFNSIEEFLEPLGITENSDFDKIPPEQLTAYFQKNTHFKDFDEMEHSAWSEFLSDELEF